jgi:hypothetical protein
VSSASIREACVSAEMRYEPEDSQEVAMRRQIAYRQRLFRQSLSRPDSTQCVAAILSKRVANLLIQRDLGEMVEVFVWNVHSIATPAEID